MKVIVEFDDYGRCSIIKKPRGVALEIRRYEEVPLKYHHMTDIKERKRDK